MFVVDREWVEKKRTEHKGEMEWVRALDEIEMAWLEIEKLRPKDTEKTAISLVSPS